MKKVIEGVHLCQQEHQQVQQPQEQEWELGVSFEQTCCIESH